MRCIVDVMYYQPYPNSIRFRMSRAYALGNDHKPHVVRMSRDELLGLLRASVPQHLLLHPED